MRAASISHRDKMELLLEEEADPDIQDNVKIRSSFLIFVGIGWEDCFDGVSWGV